MAAVAAFAAIAVPPGASPGPGIRYATDAYPGFDSEDEIIKPSRKAPRWFSWFTGPKRDTAAEQFAYAAELEGAEEWRAARKAYDALVRNWPASPEAPKAQKAMADILLSRELDYEEAFREYRYLVDFYSSQCDYDEAVETLYKTAELMREEGKTVVFFRFDNTVDVRRAYEAVVLRAPGAKFAPEAMLTIAKLREDEDKPETAVTVYENLRNLHPGTPEADEALYREAKARMVVLHRCEYNRDRVRDNIDFMRLALSSGRLDSERRAEVEGFLAEAKSMIEEEAYNAAKFYDSRTRTKRSAVSAYERFLDEYPASDMRTVSVPTFRNETDVVELGAIAARQTLREFQREGTFRIASADDAAIEVQAVLKTANAGMLNYKRGQSMRAYEFRYSLVADVSLVDRRNGKVLVDNRQYRAETTFFSDTDIVTTRRDAAGRLAEDLARQIVDDVVGYKWKNGKE